MPVTQGNLIGSLMADHQYQQPHAGTLHAEFADPPRQFGAMPFWFWNDDLDEREIVRQIQEMYAKGIGGFIPHARIGLSRRVGYLTDEFFRLMKIAVQEAARLGMKVVLYDEGAYPSGSAQGRVVAEDPAFAARCLIPMHKDVDGPASGYWRPNPSRAMQDRLVSVILGRLATPDALDPTSLTCLTVQDEWVAGAESSMSQFSSPEPGIRGLSPSHPNQELIRYDVGPGKWRLVACWDVFSGGTIRGVFDEEDDAHALAPPAADLMNPDAVASFIRHTHEAYYAHLKEHFGRTIVAMFTDEPNPMGRAPKRGPDPKPYTCDLLENIQKKWAHDARVWLGALWFDCGPKTAAFREIYDRTVQARIEEVFYGKLSRWCADHDIALTGHPARSDEMGVLRQFHWPGQDMVWRWVTPGSPSALEGADSVAPKAAASAAAISSRERNATEPLGAYGWQLTMDEAKWLLDWHLVRGNNLFFLHAFFYSIRGRRAFESQPDLGVHNVWWPHFQLLGNYLRRMCWLLSGGRPICDVAILTHPDHIAWSAARRLMPAQIDFLYIDEQALQQARVESGRLAIGALRARAVVFDPVGQELSNTAMRKLDELSEAGGVILEHWGAEDLVPRLVSDLGRDVDWPDAPDLRVSHYQKDGRDFYFLVNEGERTLEGKLSLAARGSLELWDPMDGTSRPWPAKIEKDRTHTHLRLHRRQGLVLALDPTIEPAPSDANAEPSLPTSPAPGDVITDVNGPWQAIDAEGQPVDAPCPGDWSEARDWETFSGTLRFTTELELPSNLADAPVLLDLGAVGDIAEVLVNGQSAGVRAWRPYLFDIGERLRAGLNHLEVRVTNSMANALDGAQLPSGLIGPIVLRSQLQ